MLDLHSSVSSFWMLVIYIFFNFNIYLFTAGIQGMTDLYINLESWNLNVVVQLLSHVQLFATPWTVACQASFLHYFPEFAQTMSTEPVMPSNHLILCCPWSPPVLSLSQHQGLFQWETSIRLLISSRRFGVFLFFLFFTILWDFLHKSSCYLQQW